MSILRLSIHYATGVMCGQSSLDCGNVKHGFSTETERLHDIVDEALGYGYIVQIFPADQFHSENKNNGDLLLIFNNESFEESERKYMQSPKYQEYIDKCSELGMAPIR